MTTKKPFVGIHLDDDLLRRVDDFRFNNRFQSRAKAIEFILIAGMDALAKDYPELDRSVCLETGETPKNVGLSHEKRVHL